MTSVNYIYMFNNKVVYFQHVNCIRDWGTFLPQPYSVLKRNVSNARVNNLGIISSALSNYYFTRLHVTLGYYILIQYYLFTHYIMKGVRPTRSLNFTKRCSIQFVFV
jgi:hypothetical protein